MKNSKKMIFNFVALMTACLLLTGCNSSSDKKEDASSEKLEKLEAELKDTKDELQKYKEKFGDLNDNSSNEEPKETDEKTKADNDEDKNKSELEVKSLPKKCKTEYGYTFAYFQVKNCTDKTINTISLNTNFLDEDGNIVSNSYPQKEATVKPGQSIVMEAMVETGEATSVVADVYSYFDENQQFYEGTFDPESDPIKLKN